MKISPRNCIFAGILGVLIAVAMVFIPGATAQNREAANGHGTLFERDENGRQVRRQFSFHAQRRPDGSVQGGAVLHNPAFRGENDQKYQLQIDITCMRVFGNTAVFGGTTRRTNDPNLVDAVFFTVQDNGEPGKERDKISSVFFFDEDPNTVGDPQRCQVTAPTAFPLETIEAGNIQVRQ